MSKEEQIDLIAGRIIDEYRKHPLLEWNKIAASKIHSQWFEHYTDEIAKLKASKSEANEAVEFMEWVIKNEYYYDGKKWKKDFCGKDKFKTTELYEIFKTRNNK
jgi:hypothetical protein